ncbi:ROK family transcriptional regulator [Amycolatopsis sp. MtRt-6]|uniref:ROK family transcriptional regulator n=1 Tax=Amycolatopsis sp. MtRt-6 TaxID=2792782 RepID=UPI001A8D785B|nr:ROK family transcriptional regulator [Amycolatopsis sp. MtRt-6]
MPINPTTRDHNKASVLDVVLAEAPMTRNKLIELTGLSKATVSRAVEELRADGFVVDRGVDAVAGRGRPSTCLDIPGTTGHVAGVSFGAQTTGVLVSDLRGREIQHVIVPTANHDDAGKAAAWLAGLVAGASRPAAGPLRQVVVAVPGRVRDGGEIFGPAESMTYLAGSRLQGALADLVGAPVLLDSDANASLLGILTDDVTIGNAALFSLSSMLSFACRADREPARGSTPSFGDVGVLFSGVRGKPLDGLLSTGGLLAFAREQGLGLERIDDLWGETHHDEARTAVVEAFTTALVTAVTTVVVTLDPESIYLVGRLRTLVEEVLPEVRKRLEERLPAVPRVTVATQVLGLSTARGAVHSCLALAQARLREALLDARCQAPQADQRPSPAF